MAAHPVLTKVVDMYDVDPALTGANPIEDGQTYVREGDHFVPRDVGSVSDGAVTEAKIADAAVTQAKLDSGLWIQVQPDARKVYAKGGGLDDSVQIQAAIDAAAADAAAAGRHAVRKVVLPSADYKILGTALAPKGQVWVDGLFGANLDCSQTPKTGSVRYGARAQGSQSSSYGTLTADATKGAYSITVDAVPSDVAAGDAVILYSASSSDSYPYDGTATAARGEHHEVRKIVGTTIYFAEAIFDTYAAALPARVAKVNFLRKGVWTNLHLQGANVAGDGGRALVLDRCDSWTLENLSFDGFDVYNLALASTIRTSISGVKINGVFYDGVTGTVFYAIIVQDGSQWITIEDVYSQTCRHLFVNTARSANQGFWGQPREVSLVNFVAKDCMGGAGGRSWAIEHHGFGEHINVVGGVVSDCYGGIVTRGPGLHVRDVQIRGYYQYGIEIHPASDALGQTIIDNVSVRDRSLEGGGSATAAAIYAELSNANIDELRIKADVLWSHPSSAAVQIGGNTASMTKGVVEGELVVSADCSTHVMQVSTPGFHNRMNVTGKASKVMRAAAARVKVGPARYELDAYAAGSQAILSDQDSVEIHGVETFNFEETISLAAGATNNRTSRNVAHGTPTQPFKAAAGLAGVTCADNIAPDAVAGLTVEQADPLVLPLGPLARHEWLVIKRTAFANLVGNPGFETDTSGWLVSFVGAGTLTRDTADFKTGVASGKFVTAGAAQNEGIATTSINVAGNGVYSAGGWVKAPAGATLRIVLFERNSSDGLIGSTVAAFTGTGGYQFVSVSRTFGATGVKARVGIQTATSIQAIAFNVDEATLVTGPAAYNTQAANEIATISPVYDRGRLTIRCANSTTLKDGTGNLRLAGDFVPGTVDDTITIRYDPESAVWRELARSHN